MDDRQELIEKLSTLREGDMADSVHQFFTKRQDDFYDWCEVASEAEALYKEAIDPDADECDCPALALANGTAAAAFEAALNLVAAALGVDRKGLMRALEPFDNAHFNGLPMPPAMRGDELVREAKRLPPEG